MIKKTKTEPLSFISLNDFHADEIISEKGNANTTQLLNSRTDLRKKCGCVFVCVCGGGGSEILTRHILSFESKNNSAV